MKYMLYNIKTEEILDHAEITMNEADARNEHLRELGEVTRWIITSEEDPYEEEAA